MTENILETSYHKFRDYMRTDTIGVEIGICTVSGLLFAIAYHKIRPITKFVKPSDVPNYFIKNKLKQNGIISAIEPSQTAGPLLKINHKPPINIQFTSKRTLPVKISGIEINSNGYSWLQTITVDKRVQFLPIVKNADNVECQVLLINDSSETKPILDLAECLTSLGFARVVRFPTANVKHLSKKDRNIELENYLKCLAKAEHKAKKTRSGMWADKISPPMWPINRLQKSLSQLILNVLPQNRRLPELVR